MKRVITITHCCLIGLMLIETLLQTQNIKSDWGFYALMLCWIVISQVRLYIVTQVKYQQVTLLFDMLMSGWLIFIYGQVNYSGMLMAGLSALYLLPDMLCYSYLAILYGMYLGALINKPTSFGLPYLYGVLVVVLLILIRFLLKEEQQRQVQLQQLQQMLWQEKRDKESVEASISSLKDVYVLRERNRISRELHDSVGHSLSTIVVQLGAIAKLSETNQPQVAQMANNLRTFASQGLKEVRQVIHDLKPEFLDAEQLNLALEELFKQSHVHQALEIRFRHNQATWLLDENQELTIYRACQEFLSNTQKYAQATLVNVTLMFSEAELILTLKDNGKGCANYQPHMGLKNIQERIEKLQGHCEVQTQVDQGFMLRIIIPNRQGVKGSGTGD